MNETTLLVALVGIGMTALQAVTIFILTEIFTRIRRIESVVFVEKSWNGNDRRVENHG